MTGDCSISGVCQCIGEYCDCSNGTCKYTQPENFLDYSEISSEVVPVNYKRERSNFVDSNTIVIIISIVIIVATWYYTNLVKKYVNPMYIYIAFGILIAICLGNIVKN